MLKLERKESNQLTDSGTRNDGLIDYRTLSEFIYA